MSDAVTVALDVLGGDFAPDVVLDGAAQALEADENLTLLLCGPKEAVEGFAAEHERCEAVFTTQNIEMGEHPVRAVRTKKDSPIVVGCRLVAEGRAQGFFSAGSTGACLSAGTLVIGRIKGIKRPALGQIIPSYGKPTLLIDVGANADCKPEYLLQFAEMGVVYAKRIMGVENPQVGLLNIGAEETKGSAFSVSCHKLLARKLPAFAGNCEGGDLLASAFDVVVCDGFSGNICLKTIEGTAQALFKYMKDAMMSSLATKLGAALVKSKLGELKAKLSPETYGGTPLLGVDGVCIVGHGSSNATAIQNGIAVTAQNIRSHVVDVIAETVHGADVGAAEEGGESADEGTEAKDRV